MEAGKALRSAAYDHVNACGTLGINALETNVSVDANTARVNTTLLANVSVVAVL